MARFTEEELNTLKSRVELPALIRARGVELKAHGDGHLIGKCPFHADDTPSFVVTPGKGLFHCLGCGAAGNAIQFVMKSDGVSFRHAVEVLRGDPARLYSPITDGNRSRVLPCPLDVEADDAALLYQVVEYYHERLLASPPALEYLQKRGLGDPALIRRFRLGYADRSLGLRLPTANLKAGRILRERLTALGVYRESGHEHLNGCIVVPIFGARLSNEEGSPVVNLYGRRILKDSNASGIRHMYLPGARRGVWNRSGVELPPERSAILCESIFDALSFWQAGFHAVTTAYGVEGFTDETEELLAKCAEHVFIAYDRDEPGERGAQKAASRLMSHGVECHRVKFPPDSDANEFLVKHGEAAPEEFLKLITGAEWLGKKAVETDADAGGVAADNAEKSIPAEVVVRRAGAPSSLAANRLAAEHARSLESLPVVQPASIAAKEKSPSPSSEKLAAPAPVEKAASPASSAPSAPPREPFSASDSAAPSCEILKESAEEILFALGDREYRVRGLAKNTGFETLRVSLRVACNGRWHLDTLDLCRAKERAHFIESAATETALKPDLLRRDLGRVLLQLETLQESRLRAEVTPLEKAGPVMSDEDREAALAFLKSPDLLAQIVSDFAACGVVGEETNKLTGYLAAVSRKLDRPLAVIVQSTSAAGKSALMEAVLELMPSEEKVKYSALTGQALFYLGDADIKNKILAVVEEEGAERASYALKLLQSEGELTIASTGKDPNTGRMETQEYRVEGPVMIFLTTTAADIDEELLNRCLVLTVDEGRAQTAAIHKLQRERETLAGLLRKEDKSKILAKHHAAQRLLRPLAVVNPFAESLTFRDDRTRTRRDHMKYLALIRAIAFLHQWQRPVKTVTHGGKSLSYIEVEASDIEAANRLAHEVLGRCLDEMPPQTRRLLGLLDEFVSAQASARKCERNEVLFTRREVRDATGWGDTQLRLHLDRLLSLEYLFPHRGARGQSFVYELCYESAAVVRNHYMPGLPAPARLRREAGEKFAGVKARFAGEDGRNAPSTRPERGAVAAPSRNAASRTGIAPVAENPVAA